MVKTFEIIIGKEEPKKKYICKIYYKLLDEFLANSVALKKTEDIEEKEKLTKEMRIHLITKMTVDPKLSKEFLDTEEASFDDHQLGFELVKYLGKEIEKRYAVVKKKDTNLPDSRQNPPKQILPMKSQS